MIPNIAIKTENFVFKFMLKIKYINYLIHTMILQCFE